MSRIQFKKKNEQRRFIQKILETTNAVSLQGLKDFGIETNYSTLKNYYTEQRLIPQKLYEDLCGLANINEKEFEIEKVSEHWGQKKGGKKSKRKKKENYE